MCHFYLASSIGYDGAKALCESLRPPPHGNSNIHVLDLYNNGKIGERGAKEVAEMLRTNVSITSLDLSGCNIGQGGGAAIGLALSESNRTLTRLDVSGNKLEGAIGEVGARSLAAALATNEILRYLDVEGNAIGDNGGLAFLDAVQNNSTLLGLGWRDKNRISAEVATSLEQALEEANHTCFARY